MAASESLLPAATPSSSHSYFNSSLSSLLENFPSSSSSSSSSMTSSSFLHQHHQQPPISVSSISALMVPTASPFVSEQQSMVTKSGLSTESMFSCSICHKRYSTEKYLQMHLALHKDITAPLTFSGANATGCKKFERHFLPDFQDQRTQPRNSPQHNRFASHHYKKHQAIQKRTNFFPPRHQSIEKIKNQCHYQFLSPPKLLPPSFNNQSQQHQQQLQQHYQCSQSYGSNAFAFDRSNQFLPLEEDNFRNSATKYNFLALSGGQSNMYSSACYNNYEECPHYADQSSSNLAPCAGMSTCGTNVISSNRSVANQRFQKASQSFTSLQQSAQLTTQIWTCAYCSKTFTQSSNYKNHVRTHSDERPYVCELCSIGFKERYHLKKHLLFKHSTEAKEECRFCGKRFKDSTAVRAHERIHSDQRPYSCQRCRKAFKTSECLWHHENRSRTCGKALDNLRTEGATSKTCSAASNPKNNIIPFSQNSADQQVRQTKKNPTIQRKVNGGTKKKNNSLLLQTKPATHREILSPVPSKDFQQKDDRSDCIVKVENDGFSYSSNFGISCDLQTSENVTFGSSSRMLYKNAQLGLALRSTPFQESYQNNEITNAYRDDHPTYTQLRPLNMYGKNLTTFDISRDKVDDISTQLHACENFEKFDSKYVNFNPNTTQNFDSNQTCPQFSDRNITSKTSSCRMLENSKFNEEVMLGSPNVINQISKTDICDSSMNDNKTLFLSCIEESKTRFTKSMAIPSPEGGVRWQQDTPRYNCLDETQYQRYESPRNYANQDYRLLQQTCSYEGHIESNHSRHFQHGNQAYHHQYSPFYSHHHHQHLLLPTAIVAPIKRPNETMNDGGNLSSISLSSDQSIHPSFFTSTSSFTNMMTSNVDDKNVYQLQSQDGDFIDDSNMADATRSSNQELGRVYYDKTQEINSSNGNPTDHLDLKSLPPFETFVPATKSPTPHQQATLADIGEYDSTTTSSSLVNLDEKEQQMHQPQNSSRQDLLSVLNSDEGFQQQMEAYNAFQTD